MKTILLTTLVSLFPLTALAQIDPTIAGVTAGESDHTTDYGVAYEDYWDMDMTAVGSPAPSPGSASILGNGNVLLAVECMDEACGTFSVYDILFLDSETEIVELATEEVKEFYRPTPCGEGLVYGAMCTNELSQGAQRLDDGLIAVVIITLAQGAQSLDEEVINDCLDLGVFDYAGGEFEFEAALSGDLLDVETCEGALDEVTRIELVVSGR